jgi:hypothetical protein
MRLDFYRQVKVSRRATVRTVFTLSSQDQMVTIINARRYFNFDPCSIFFESITSTYLARLLGYLSSAIAPAT